MNEFFKRNLVWVAILLCITGVVLSIIGIPAGNPIFFFIGIILALPTIGYLIYQVFFYRENAELNLAPSANKISTSNITSIVADKHDVLLQDKITNNDDLESLYDGYANDQEITKRLREVTSTERERIIVDLPTIDLPVAQPSNAFDNTTAIQNTTNDELARQREESATTPMTLTPEVIPDSIAEEETANITANDITEENSTTPYTVDVDENDFAEFLQNKDISEPAPVTKFAAAAVSTPTKIIEDVSVTEYDSPSPSLDDPNFNPSNEPLMPQNIMPADQAVTIPVTNTNKNLTQVDLTNAKIVYINPEQNELRKKKAQEKKNLLAQANLERYLQRYFIETAACFLMDRTIYKDKNGIAPYNKFAVNKDTNLPEYTMSSTKGRLYKFCTYLIDTERFIKHPNLYDSFITEIERGVPLARISETLHPLYRKKYKKDFVLNLSNREDWDNVMILVYNNYLLSNNNFKNVFTHVPFEIPFAYNDENIIDYLKDPDVQDRFAEKYSALEEMGIPTFWDAVYICFINSIKQKLSIEQIETALLREYKKIARALKRADNTRRKLLKKAS